MTTSPLSSSFSPFTSLSCVPSSSPSPFSFCFRAYTTSLDSDDEKSGEDSFNDSDASDDPFSDASDADWVKEQDSDNEESELELGGKTIPAQRKPYSTLETNFLIRTLKKQLENGEVVPEGERVKDLVKDFTDLKNNEELNKTVDILDEGIAHSLKVFVVDCC